jgi:hypothetical protein
VEEKEPLPVEMVETIVGTWVNPDYNVIENKYAKIKFVLQRHYDKKWFTYNTISYKELLKKGTYTIVEGWRGDEYKNIYYDDNTCYKIVRTTDDGIKKYELYKFSEVDENSHLGRVLEIVSSTEDFPTEINTEDSTYSILYLVRGEETVGEIARGIIFIPLMVYLIYLAATL